jgi:DNA-binding IclR family transcriptional regulator
LFSKRAHEIAAAGIGDNWEAFKRTLAGLRRDGVCITKGEIDVGFLKLRNLAAAVTTQLQRVRLSPFSARVGIAAPIFGQEGAILGSLSFVLPVAQADETRIARLVPLTVAGAREIDQAMTQEAHNHR